MQPKDGPCRESNIVGNKVLIVDDDPKLFPLVETQLKVRGFEALQVPDKAEALEKLKTMDIPIAVIDIGLVVGTTDDISGINLAALLRQQYPTIGIIVITNHPEKALGA